ncbi:MAG: HD-GYP domain-containing protein [Planctomycetota bacterium]|jgi:HD-GYP domain-containing protein (c-di-GMP phosphodiesterase class II)
MTIQQQRRGVDRALRTLLEAGFVPARVAADGGVAWPQSQRPAESLRIELFRRSRMLERRLAELVRRWRFAGEDRSAASIFEGLRAIPLDVPVEGMAVVALAVSEAFLRDDRLDAMCATAGADRRAMESLLRRGGLVPEGDFPRQERLLRELWGCLDDERRSTGTPATATTGIAPRGAAGVPAADAPIEALVGGIDRRDPTNRGHSRRVAILSRLLTEALGGDADACRRAELAGLVHDVGKVALPSRILRKPGPLNRREYAQVRKHPQIGCRMLRGWLGVSSVLDAVKHHHERWDGLGYPTGLQGGAIPRLARIVAIADAFDAMTSDRPYREALSVEEAKAEMKRCAGTHFDPEMIPVFLGLDLTEYEQRRAYEEERATARQAA